MTQGVLVVARNNEVIDYLKTENSYTDNWFSKQTDYKTPIVSELMNQVPETEISFPVKNNGYLYYQKIKKEEQLPKYYKKGIDDGDEIMFLDANLKLQAQKYYSIRTISPSNDNSMIAFAEDNNGRREFTIKILDANTLKELNTLIETPLNDVDFSTYVKGYNSKSYIYDLYGVCNHSGGVSGGHYTSYVKNANGKWYEFNDTRVNEIAESHVISQKSYCFFYRKK